MIRDEDWHSMSTKTDCINHISWQYFKPQKKKVSMCLDLNAMTVSYGLNDGDEIIVFKNIQNGEYKAAVYSFWEEDCVQFLGSKMVRYSQWNIDNITLSFCAFQ